MSPELHPVETVKPRRIRAGYAAGQVAPAKRNQYVLLYWLLGAIFSALILHDELANPQLDRVVANWPIALFAIVATVGTQIAYVQVAKNDGRRFDLPTTVLFVVANGVIEALTFLAFVKVGIEGGRLLWGDVGAANFLLGALAFIIYSGIIHAFFWVRVFPPHFSDAPELQRLRRGLEPMQAVIALSWTLLFFATRDVWTVILLHMVIDTVLMIRVRPPLFFATRA